MIYLILIFASPIFLSLQMKEFSTSLQREKFVIQESGTGPDAEPVIALSNRIQVTLETPSGESSETFIIRTQNMHSCVRLAAMLCKEFAERGPIMGRSRDIHYPGLWSDIVRDYEIRFNSVIWAVIYYKGRLLFQTGEHHPFLDIIEKCDVQSPEGYEHAVRFAEQAFMQAGKSVKISHDSNIALVINIKPHEARCGVIIRGANRTATFSFTTKQKDPEQNIKIASVLNVSAAFLEGVQLAFFVGMHRQKLAYTLIERGGEEHTHLIAAERRLAYLNSVVHRYEKIYAVRFRPEKPEFLAMAEENELAAKKIIAPLVQEKIRLGEISKSVWVD